jgi:cysteine synthase
VQAEARGESGRAQRIIEATSATPASGSALLRRRGYRVVLTMPDSCVWNADRYWMRWRYDRFTESGLAWRAQSKKRNSCFLKYMGSKRLLQFENPDNPAAHEATTGPEYGRKRKVW